MKYRVKGAVEGKVYRCPKCKEPLSEPAKIPTEDEGQQAALDHDAQEKEAKSRDRLVGRTVGQYRILEVIGKGGMGTVYKAEHIALGRVCALKVLAPELVARDRVYVERFLREARSAAGLNHPNVVAVYNVGGVEETYFIEMEYVKGKSLQGLMAEKQGLPLGQATEIAIGVAKALREAQAKSIVHRDIKPDNILLGDDGAIKVTDFGLAKTVEAASHITETGSVVGTPYFMSPEQCEGEAADCRADIYALGATYYYVLTGRLPYVGRTALSIMYKHKHDAVPDIRAVRPDLPESVHEFITKVMAKKPEDRFQTASEMLSALQAIMVLGCSDAMNAPAPDAQAAQAKVPSTAARLLLQNRPVPNILGAACGLGLGLLVLWAFAPQPAPQPILAPVRPPAKTPHKAPVGKAKAGSKPQVARAKAKAAKPPQARRIVVGQTKRVAAAGTGARKPAAPPRHTVVVLQSGGADYSSIFDALDKAASNTVVNVLDSGRYDEGWPKPQKLAKLRKVAILASPGRAPVLTIGPSGPPLVLGQGGRLSGFRLDIDPKRTTPAISVTSSAKIDNCFFLNGQCAIAWTGTGLEVTNCVFLGNGKGTVLEVRDSPEEDVLRTLKFANNTAYRWGCVVAVPCRSPQNFEGQFIDNIIAKVAVNIHENSHGGLLWPPLKWDTHHNCYFKLGKYFVQGGKEVQLQANVLADWRTALIDRQKATSPELASLETDPKFVNAADWDLQLKPSSPCKATSSQARDRGAMWDPALWRKWLPDRSAALAAAQKRAAQRKKELMEAGLLSRKLEDMLAHREYEALIKTCDDALKQTNNAQVAASLKYWQRLAQVGADLIRRAGKQVVAHVGQEYTLVVKVGRGKQRLKGTVLKVENGVIKFRFGKKEMDRPVSQLAAETILALTRKSDKPDAARLLAEATFLFGEGDHKAAQKALAAIPKEQKNQAIAAKATRLTQHWDVLIAAEKALAHEEEAEKLASQILKGIESGDTAKLEEMQKRLETEYRDTAAYAKVADRMASIRLVVAGDAIYERVKPKSTKPFAYSAIKHTIERRMGGYRDTKIIVKKKGGQAATIAKAISMAKGRTKIEIADSETYQEGIQINTPSIMIRAAEGAKPTIAPTGRMAYTVSAKGKDITLVGLRFSGGWGMMFTECENLTIVACQVDGANGLSRGAISVEKSPNTIIADNLVQNAKASGISIQGCPNAIVANNRCLGNARNGLDATGGAVVTGNLFAFNGCGISFRAHTEDDDPQTPSFVEGNILWRNIERGVWSSDWPDRTLFQHNLVAGNGGQGIHLGAETNVSSAVIHNVLCANFGSQIAMQQSQAATATAVLVRDNVIDGLLFGEAWAAGSGEPASVVDRNLVFSPRGPQWYPQEAAPSLKLWQKTTRQSLNSQWGRPTFAKPDRYDFHLQTKEDAKPVWGLPTIPAIAKQWAKLIPYLDNPVSLHMALLAQVSRRRQQARRSGEQAVKQTIRVAKTGKADCKSIKDALAKAKPGFIIEITDSASYEESVIVDKPNIVIRAKAGSPRPPTIRASKDAPYAVSLNANNPTLMGVRVTGGRKGIVITSKANRARVIDNTVENAADAGIYATGVSDVIIASNICRNCRDGVAVAQANNLVLLGNRSVGNTGIGLSVRDALSVFLVGNECHDNAGAGIKLDGAQGASVFNNLSYNNKAQGIACLATAYLFLEHNTLYGNADAGIQAAGIQQWARIVGNIAAKNQVGIDANGCKDAQPLVVSWNGVHGNSKGYGKWRGKPTATLSAWQKASGLGAQSTSSAPGFKSAKKADFQLGKNSSYAKKAPDGKALGVRWSDWSSHLKAAALFAASQKKH